MHFFALFALFALYCPFQASWPHDHFSQKNSHSIPSAITWQWANISHRKLYQTMRKIWPVQDQLYYVDLHVVQIILSVIYVITGICTIRQVFQFRSSWKLLCAARLLMMTTGQIFHIVWYSFRWDLLARCQVMADGMLWEFFYEKWSRGQLAWKGQ